MTDKPRAKGPVCGKPAVRKISGAAGPVFKRSGFYITDYGKDGKGPRKDPTQPAADSTPKSDTAGKPAKDAPKPGPAESPSPKTKTKASGE
jgi:predicted nucleic acid-binding Zn ribbon protein